MAEVFSPNTGHTDPAQLEDFLVRKHYSAPNLKPIEEAFLLLQERLSQGRHTPIDDEEAEATEEVISARTAREDALPVVTILPTGTFAMGIPSRGEVFKCVAFGTISPEIYHDMVWDEIQRIPGYSQFEIGVHEVTKKPILRFLISFKGQVFELKYFPSATLVRSNLDILETSVSFLEDHCNEALQETVKELKESAMIRTAFESQSSRRRAYYAIRAWAIARGLLSERSSKEIIKYCIDSSGNAEFDLNLIVQSIFGQSPPGLSPYPENNCGDWINLLETLENMPIHHKIGASHYIIINVMHTGCSSTQAGQWLTLIESRLPKLKESLKANIPKRSGDPVSVWPYRLVADDADPKAKDYEGFFVFGLNFPNGMDQLRITEPTEKWRTNIQNHELSLPGRCFISYMTKTALDFENDKLKTCPRTLSRPFLAAESTIEEEEEPEKEKSKGLKSKKNVQTKDSDSNFTPTAKLRMASDIHNRLKHDNKYNIDEYVMGYEDRISNKIVEKAAGDWIRETTDVAFIPEQRVRYFKRYLAGKEEIVWDRALKVDKIFGSGNSAS